VLALLSSSLSESASLSNIDVTLTRNASPILVEPLSPADTPLTPESSTGQLIAVASSWIDLGSPDPIIADISAQVLRLELSYAAFCGITYVIIPGPRLCNGSVDNGSVAQYARSILDSLNQGPYMQLYIWLPMIRNLEDEKDGMGDLAPFARPNFLEQSDSGVTLDIFGTWEAWDTIRSICGYPSRLFVGMGIPSRSNDPNTDSTSVVVTDHSSPSTDPVKMVL
jgi:protein arginine N-methyltransferase 5